MAKNSTQITGIVFSELKAEKKQIVTEKLKGFTIHWY